MKLCSRARSTTASPRTIRHDPGTEEYAAEKRISKERFEFQMLYGVRRDLQRRLTSEGYNMRIYIPYGRQWYPYFMRRLAERPQT